MRTSKDITGIGDVNYVYENGLLLQMDYLNYIYDFSYDANGTPVGFKFTTPSGAESHYYYGLNYRGDIVAIYNSAGTKVATYSYDAYGKPLTTTHHVSGHATAVNNNPLRYRGYVYDRETGFYYLQSRYYDPVTCRFINEDIYYDTGLGFTGLNMFAYCSNNPIMSYDPTGTREPVGGGPISTETAEERYLSCKRQREISSYTYNYSSNDADDSYIDKLAQTVCALSTSVYFEAGVGYGLGVSVEPCEVVEFEALMKNDMIYVRGSEDGFDIGSNLIASFAVSIFGKILPNDLLTYEVGEYYYYSAIDDKYYYSVEPPNSFTLFEAGGYCIFGASFKAAIDIDKFNNKKKQIWGD